MLPAFSYVPASVITSLFTKCMFYSDQQEHLGIQMAEFKVEIECCWSEGKGLIDVRKELEKKSVRKVRKAAEVPATPTRRSARVKKMQHVDEMQEQEETADDVLMQVN